jgi:hypothetical protein
MELSDAEGRKRMTQGASHGIHRISKSIVDGSTSPRQGLKEIVSIAYVARLGATDWRKAPIWPVFRYFFPAAKKWYDAEREGETSPQLIAELEAEVVAAARALVGDRSNAHSG